MPRTSPARKEKGPSVGGPFSRGGWCDATACVMPRGVGGYDISGGKRSAGSLLAHFVPQPVLDGGRGLADAATGPVHGMEILQQGIRQRYGDEIFRIFGIAAHEAQKRKKSAQNLAANKE